jgi:hypothetical protein
MTHLSNQPRTVPPRLRQQITRLLVFLSCKENMKKCGTLSFRLTFSFFPYNMLRALSTPCLVNCHSLHGVASFRDRTPSSIAAGLQVTSSVTGS